MTCVRVLAVLAGLVAGTLTPRAQSRPPLPPTPPSHESITTAVLVDVVVRDRQGRIVTDLKAEDFELREDGVVQTLGSFTRVARGGGVGINVGVKNPSAPTLVAPPPDPATPSIPESPAPYPAVTALVFDALTADAVSLCQRAALDYVPMTGLLSTRVGVFTTDPQVRALQSYTDDPALVRQGVRRVLPTGTTLKEVQVERLAQLREERERLDALGEPAATASAGGAGLSQGGAAAIGQLEIQRSLLKGEMRTLRAFETLDRDQRGFGTTGALFSVLQSLVELPGRKTLVFFSEGLPASPALQAHLQSVIEAANRVNVTVYAVDASGLRAISGTRETRAEIEEAGKERMRQLSSPTMLTEEPIMRLVERTEDLVRFDSQGGLAYLAEQTGGFLVRDTNDLRQAFRRIDEDMRFHYLLTYSPARQVFDGKFRAIGVKVKRPGVEVFARKGYRALRFPPTVPVLGYEAPALAALDAERLPNGFPFSSVALNFPERLRPGLSPLVVRVRTDALTYHQDTTKQTYQAEASIVARVRDQAGNIVHKVSQQYQLNGRLAELEAAKKGQILFYREPELVPGLYTVETVVFDAMGDRASAKAATLEVPRAAEDETRVSSVVVVRTTERVAPDQRQPGNPLYVGDLLLYPNGGEPLSRAGDRELTFYYAVYLRTAAQPPSTAIELRRNGRTLAQVPVTIGRPDADGRIQQVSRIPLEPLADGIYELRVIVRDGAQSIERATFFKVEG
jgi:VWFA-related protein